MIGNKPLTTIGGLLPAYFLPPTIPRINTGILAPAITPERVGDIFINTAAGSVYISVHVTDATGWKEL